MIEVRGAEKKGHGVIYFIFFFFFCFQASVAYERLLLKFKNSIRKSNDVGGCGCMLLLLFLPLLPSRRLL